MPVITETLPIAAPPERVFADITDVARFPETQPEVLAVEFLTEGGFSGIGTRFREIRDMGRGKTLVTELEVTEYAPEAGRVRMVADTHGTVWDTQMTVAPAEAGSQLTIAMDARGNTALRRVVNVFMQPLFRRGIRSHLRAVKERMEGEAEGGALGE